MPVVPALRGQRQEVHEFQPPLAALQDPVSKKNKRKKRKLRDDPGMLRMPSKTASWVMERRRIYSWGARESWKHFEQGKVTSDLCSWRHFWKEQHWR
jgi:hypothetical protein